MSHLLEIRHIRCAKVWLGIVAFGLGCAEPYTPVSPGAIGYLSDNALEIDARFQRTVHVPCDEVGEGRSSGSGGSRASTRLLRDVHAVGHDAALRGRPLMLEHAAVSVDVQSVKAEGAGQCEVRYEGHVESLITSSEMEARGTTRDAYEGDAEIEFGLPGDGALEAAPDYGALGEDDTLDVGVVFGQMNPDGLQDDDAGYWSARALEGHLLEKGLTVDVGRGAAGGRLMEGRVGRTRVRVEIVDPGGFSLGADGASKAALLGTMLAQHEVVYLNGHAFQTGMEALWDAGSYGSSAQYRVVVLDICWSYYAYAKKILDAVDAGRVAVVAVPGRVVTGSVNSFALLIDALTAGVEAGGGDRWYGILRRMNALAEERATTRAGVIDPALREAEVYGVGSLWETRDRH